MYKDLVSPNGIIAFHDIAVHSPSSACKVNLFWNEVKQLVANWEEYIENPNQGWAGVGVLDFFTRK
jgi:hypothetical protein